MDDGESRLPVSPPLPRFPRMSRRFPPGSACEPPLAGTARQDVAPRVYAEGAQAPLAATGRRGSPCGRASSTLSRLRGLGLPPLYIPLTFQNIYLFPVTHFSKIGWMLRLHCTLLPVIIPTRQRASYALAGRSGLCLRGALAQSAPRLSGARTRRIPTIPPAPGAGEDLPGETSNAVPRGVPNMFPIP